VVAAGRVELAVYGDDALARRLGGVFGTVADTEVEPGWEDAWRAHHRPVRIGPLWVGPPWEIPPPGAIAVVIDPAQAFGTGAHATTQLCLELLLARSPSSVLDVGCGSGVLAIAAARLGFRPVAAIDEDPAAVAAARDNARTNGVAVDVHPVDVESGPLPSAVLALANLELRLVPVVARGFTGRLLVTSGYLAGDHPIAPGWRLLERRERDGWAAELRERVA
jgi:ribosomal protein L11 methyltransferase